MSRPGSFCTSVLKTSEPDRAARFYNSLLGWTTKPATPDHTFLQSDGKTVASIQGNQPPRNTYFLTLFTSSSAGVLERLGEIMALIGITEHQQRALLRNHGLARQLRRKYLTVPDGDDAQTRP